MLFNKYGIKIYYEYNPGKEVDGVADKLSMIF